MSDESHEANEKEQEQGQKDLSPRQERAIGALLTAPTIVQAAQETGISERTLRRWTTQPAFQSELRRARRQALGRAVGRLQQVAERAVDALDQVMQDEKASPANRVSAARTALRFACHGAEIDDFEERLSALEQIRKDDEEDA